MLILIDCCTRRQVKQECVKPLCHTEAYTNIDPFQVMETCGDDFNSIVTCIAGLCLTYSMFYETHAVEETQRSCCVDIAIILVFLAELVIFALSSSIPVFSYFPWFYC